MAVMVSNVYTLDRGMDRQKQKAWVAFACRLGQVRMGIPLKEVPVSLDRSKEM